MNKPNLHKQRHVNHQQRCAHSAPEPYVHASERTWVRRVTRGMAALLLSQTTLFAVPVYAQVTPSAGAAAGQRPIMDAAQNGVPIVHIAPPSAGGVSRNQYDQFNVNPNGLILNNSPTAVQTRQGGWITGNLQLGPTPARIILNEVVGANPSQLRGTIEVAGQRADIVVANPNGITCDGCGFLNSSRATLTTGQPQFNGDGSIRGLDVRQGQVNVGSNGLNAANIEQLDLIARGIVIEGEVWAKNLNVLAGANQVLYGTLQATAQGGSGPAPQFAIDIKNLGGMYANQVYLVSSELGVGVNSTGRMAALQGNLVLSANGDLSLKDSYAKQNIQINGAGNVALGGQTQSEGATALAAAGTVTNQGSIDSQGQLAVNAASITNSGSIAQRNTQGATLTATGNFSNTGTLYAAGPVAIQSGAFSNRAGKIGSNQNLAVQATGVDNTDGELGGNGVSVTSTAAVNNTRGKIVSDGNLNLSASSLNNTSGIVSAQQAAGVRLGSGLLDNTQGQLVGSQSLALQSGEIRNSAGVIASGAGLSLDTQGAALTNTSNGQIVAHGDLSISSASFDNRTGTAASIAGRLQVNTNGQSLQNDGGKLQAAGNATINAGATSSQNGLITGQDIAANTGTFNNDNGQIVAGGTLTLGTQSLSNNAGLLQSVGNGQINTNGQALSNASSGNTGGIVAGGTLTLNAGSINNQAGFIASTGSQTLTVTGDLDNRAASGQAGQIVSNADTTIAAGNVNNQGGSISALGNAGITTGLLDNRAGAIAANGNVQVTATTLDNRAQNGTAGSIDGTNITISSATIDNRAGAIRGGNDVTLASTTLDNTGGSTTAVRNLTLTSTGMANASGRMVANQMVTINTGSQTLGGTVASSNNVTLNVSGDYSNTGLLSAQNDLSVNATNVTNSGTLNATNALTVNTGNLANSGEISARAVTLNASGTLTNTVSGLIDSTDTRINAGTVNNTGRIYGDMLRINAGTVNNSGAGVIAARNTLLIGAQTLNNTNGALIYSLGNIGIGGSIDANGQLQGTMQNLTNASAKIEAGGTLSINSANILNRNDGLVTTQVADAPVHQEKVQPNGSATQYPNGQCYGIGGGQDDNGCVVHPDKYGQRSTVTPVTSQVCTIDPNTYNPVCTTQVNYAWNDPVFARFQVTPVSSPPPTEPMGGCTSVDPSFGMVTPVNSPACNQWRTDYATWDTAFQATLTALDAQITPYNAQVNEDNRIDHFEDYTWYKLNSTTSRTVVTATAPGQILSGGSMSLTGSVTNRDSQIVAGSTMAIAGPAVNNLAAQGETRTDYSGTAQFTEVVACGFFGGSHCRNWYGVNPYNPAPISVMVDLPTVRFETLAGNQTTVRTIATATGSADTSVANTATTANGTNRNATGQAVQATLAAGTPSVLTVPSNSLFLVHAEPGARYLVETDPRFTNFRTFISSDYFLQSINLDPSRQLKRYGDGFMEQQLVNDQILALTGRRFLDGYASTETEYKGLMDAGVAFARQYRLSPGVALSAEQMALLTTDIVWFTARTVTLADGSTQQVLAPQVYLRRPNNGDLQANGSLIAASDVLIQTTGNLTNSGTISGNTVTALTGNDLVNQGGRIGGQDIFMRANNDLKNLSGVIQGTGANSTVTLLAGRDIVLQTQTRDTVNNDGSSTRSSVQRIATIQGGDIRLNAGRDLAATGASVAADNTLVATAGRDIRVAAVAGEYQLNVQDKSGRSTEGRTAYIKEAATTNQLSSFKAGGDITLAANNDIRLQGVNIDAGSANAGNLVLQGQNVSIEAVKDRVATDIQTIGAKSYNRVARDNETLVSGSITSGNNITVRATGTAANGNGNITLTGANIAAQNGQVTLAANNDITVQNATTQHSAIDESYVKSGSLFSSVTTTKSSKRQVTQAEGSSVSGNTIVAQAGHDLTVQGSAVVGDGDVNLNAGNKASIVAGTSTSTKKEFSKVEENGFLSGGGGFGISYGRRVTTTELDQDGTTQSGQERSLVGSNKGSLTVTSGDALKVSGSDLAAAKDINLQGKSVTIDTGRDDSNSKFVTKMEQDAFTLALTGSVVNAIQTMQTVGEAAGKTKNTRIKALAAATAGLAASNAAREIAQNGPSIGISLTYGHSESEQTQTNSSSTTSGSTVNAGRDLNIVATGAGKDSNITVTGSDLSAKNNVTLAADNQITLQSAQDLEEQHSKSSSMSYGVGVAATIGKDGPALGFSASVGAGRGQEDGSGVTQRNTHVNAGNVLTMASGGDTNIKGAVASGKQVVADVGGNLNIESLQDTAKFDSKSQNASLSGTYGFGASVSASYNKSTIHNDYASVQEQSGIVAGDGGFQVNVKGNTDLKGSVIASTQAAIDANRNRLTTATLTQSDIQNHADYNADSIGISGGFTIAGGDGRKGEDGKPVEDGKGKGPGGTSLMNVAGSSGFKMGMPAAMVASGSDSSVTRSGISAGVITITDEAGQQQRTGKTAQETIASINRNVATGMDTSGRIANNFDKEEIQAGFTVVTAFTKEVGTYIELSAAEADAKKKAAQDPKLSKEQRDQLLADAKEIENRWGPGGTLRQLVTAFTVAASGNTSGSMGQLLQNASIAYLQGLGVGEVKKIADSFFDQNGNTTTKSETIRAALQAIVGCAGAAASNQSCGAGAMGAAASVVLNNVLDATTKDADQMSNSEKEARRNLVASIVAGIGAATGAGNVATLTNSAVIETENNLLKPRDLKAILSIVKNCKDLNNCKQVSGQLVQDIVATSNANERILARCYTKECKSALLADSGQTYELLTELAKADIANGPGVRDLVAASIKSQADALASAERNIQEYQFFLDWKSRSGCSGNDAQCSAQYLKENVRDGTNVVLALATVVGGGLVARGLYYTARLVISACSTGYALCATTLGIVGGEATAVVGAVATDGALTVSTGAAAVAGSSATALEARLAAQAAQEARIAGQTAQEVRLAEQATQDAAVAAKLGANSVGTTFNGLTGPGPLGQKIANTFRSGTYTELTTSESTTLYRVWGGKSSEIGPYWTRVEPSGPVQSIVDSALNPAWGNTATKVVRIEVPSGVKIYEGVAAPQGGLVGGGNQVFIPKVDPAWIIK